MQAVDAKRRKPRQARAHDTVEVIFEATARILQRDGRDGLTTNHIAERAGISVGTLYQYFENKEAILVAMARREIRTMADTITRTVANRPADPPGEVARGAVRALIAESGRRRKVRRAAFQALIAAGLGHELERNLDDTARVVAIGAGRLLAGRRAPIAPVTAFILTRAVNGVLSAAASEGSALLGTPEFEDELVRLVRCFLGGAAVPPAASVGGRDGALPSCRVRTPGAGMRDAPAPDVPAGRPGTPFHRPVKG